MAFRTEGIAQGSWKNDVVYYRRTLVQRYIQLAITELANLFPDIGRSAKVLAHHLQLSYVAGLWKETLSTDIL
jgi:hypothetical protein